MSVAASILDTGVGLSLPTRTENADPYYAKAKDNTPKRGKPKRSEANRTEQKTHSATNQTQTEESQSTKGHHWPLSHTHTSQAKSVRRVHLATRQREFFGGHVPGARFSGGHIPGARFFFPFQLLAKNQLILFLRTLLPCCQAFDRQNKSECGLTPTG